MKSTRSRLRFSSMAPARARASIVAAGILAASFVLAEPSAAAAENPAAPSPIRCAVMGNLVHTGLWPQLAERFTNQTGLEVEVTVTGRRPDVARAFALGEADLITMPAGDTIMNLVADGFAEDPQPWVRTDFVLVGPADDPAGVFGETDAVVALEKLIRAGATLLVHKSHGAREVLGSLLDEADLDLDPAHTLFLPSTRHRQMLFQAAENHAYALVARVPYLSGTPEDAGLKIMVRGDSRMRRPCVVAVAALDAIGEPRHAAARRLAAFLRLPETQDWIAEFGRGALDDRPLYFPVVVAQE